MRTAVLFALGLIFWLLFWSASVGSTAYGPKDSFGTDPLVKAQLTRVAVYAAFTATPSPTPGPAPTATPTPGP